MRRAARLLALSSAACACALAVPAAAATMLDAPGIMTVNLPLSFEGHYEGDIAAHVAMDGAGVELDSQRLIALLGSRLSDQHRLALGSGTGRPFVSLETLHAMGIEASYDPGTLEIAVTIPVARQGAQPLTARDLRKQPEPTISESRFAATAVVQAQERYQWAANGSKARRDPIDVGVDLAASLGPVELFAQFGYRGGRYGGLERGSVVLLHDDVKHAIRYSAGDLAPQNVGYQASPLIGGVSVERQYGVIQPYRNVRPSGQLGFILENASTVDVVVNGTVLRTLRLESGQYSLADFPFFNGLNAIELYIVDNSGRRLLARFAQYFSPRLLEKGLLEFGATGGVLQRSGDSQASDENRYLLKRPAFSGYVRYGLFDNFTGGANLQAGRNQAMGGAEGSLATPIGTFAAIASASTNPDMGRGYAGLIGYEGSAQRIGFLIRPQLNLEFQEISRGFSPLQLLPQVNRYRTIAQGRFATQLPAAVSFGVSLARYAGRDGEPDQVRYAATVGRRFGPVSATLAAERIDTSGPQRQSHMLLTLTMPLGGRGSVRGTADTRGRRASLEYTRFQPDEVGTFGMRAALTRGEDGFEGSGELSYYHNRFAALLQHRLVTEADLGRITGQQTALTLSSQMAFADGRLAFGRPVGPRFMIVSAHPSLEDAIVAVRQGAGRTRPQAVVGALGPALGPAGNSYTASDIRIDVDNLPPGYDIGTSQYTTIPSQAAGYTLTIGSDASRTLLGIALGPGGQPLGLLGGLVRPLDTADSGEPILLFTNRAGRFAGNGLGPGRYEVILGTEHKFRAEVSIPAKSRGTVDVGNLQFTEVLP